MQKKNFVSMVLGVVGGLMFSLGMCMCLIPEWSAFKGGVILGAAGAAVLLIMIMVRRKMEGKNAVHLTGKTIGATLLGVFGALVLGVGMCMVMVWNMLVWGILVGILGIVLLLCLIPVCVGLK